MTPLVLVISYRNNAQLLSFLAQSSLGGSPGLPLPTVVAVANGLTPGELTGLQEGVTALRNPAIILRASSTNPGYFGGASAGFTQFLRDHPLPDWVIVTNDDIYFSDDFLPALRSLQADGVGAVAPDIRVPASGNHQNPFLVVRPTRFQLELRNFLYSRMVLFRMLMAYRRIKRALLGAPVRGTAGLARNIYAPHGACILFSSEYFRRGGTLRHPGFLYGEENFVAETCAHLGLTVRFEPALKVEHHEHSAIGRLASAQQLNYMRQATRMLLTTYYRRARSP